MKKEEVREKCLTSLCIQDKAESTVNIKVERDSPIRTQPTKMWQKKEGIYLGGVDLQSLFIKRKKMASSESKRIQM